MISKSSFWRIGLVCCPLLILACAAPRAEATYMKYVHSLDPEAYWRLNGDGNPSGAFRDETGVHHATSATAGTTFNNPAQPLIGSTGNTAAGFTKSQSSRLVVPNAPGLKIGLGESLTMAAFIKLENITGHQTVFGRGRTSASQGANYTLRTQGGRLSFYFRNSTNKGYPLYTSDDVVLTAGDWIHVALTHTFGTTDDTKLYVNGQEVAASPSISGTGNLSDAPFNSNEELWIGEIAGGLEPLGGLIDEVVLFRSILTAEQVAKLADTSTSLPEPASFALLAGGLLGFGVIAAKRRGARAALNGTKLR